MIKTNLEQVVEVSVCGDVVHPEISPSSMINGESSVAPSGVGGVTYNVRVGDAAFGWAWGDSVSPGVAIRNADAGAASALTGLACIGNEALIVRSMMEGKDAKVKGAHGVVTGKSTRCNQVTIHFPKRVVERLCVGDRIQIRSVGSGLRLADHASIRIMNCSPKLLRAINPSEKSGRVRITVAKLIPGNILGSGSGSTGRFSGDLEIQSVSSEAVKEYSLDMVRLGDLVAISDFDCTNGPCWQRDAVTIGVVVRGAAAGRGPGINVLMTSSKEILEPIITRKANISEMLNLS